MPFQEIVNTYGIPMYKEANPGLFTVVTFPFMFGMMFGDIGHGGLMLIGGLLLCAFHPWLKGGAMDAFCQIRYLICMMGMFAFYNGWIYNEFFAIPMEVFGSCYSEDVKKLNPNNDATGYLRTRADDGDWCVYSFGMDPRWF